jgi:hypothetical protein
MFVRIKSAPRGLDLYGVTQMAVCYLAKAIFVNDVEKPFLDIENGNDADLAKLAKYGIIAEKVSN